MRLFAQSAARLQTKFTLSRETLPAVGRICRLVQGNPLAIEMAAAWLERHTPSQIAAQIAMELETLAASRQDLAERQRGARAVFVKSWEQLSAAEKSTLKRATIFRGGFDSQAARAVLAVDEGRENAAEMEANCELSLGDLVEKALLLEEEAGRFYLQPLVADYAAERLGADGAEIQRVERRHAEFFACRLQILGKESSTDTKEAAGDFRREIDNLRQAWEWAVAHADTTLLGQGQDGLARFYTQNRLPEEGEAAFQAAAAAIRPLAEIENPGGERQALLARLCMHLGRFQLQRGRTEAASASFQEARQLAKAANDAKLDG